jgi:hypothetical protein
MGGGGVWQLTLTLTMNEHFHHPRYSLVPYVVNTAMPNERPRGLELPDYDKASDTVSNLLGTIGRLVRGAAALVIILPVPVVDSPLLRLLVGLWQVDALVSPLTAALAAILYLQQWRSLCAPLPQKRSRRTQVSTRDLESRPHARRAPKRTSSILFWPLHASLAAWPLTARLERGWSGYW